MVVFVAGEGINPREFRWMEGREKWYRGWLVALCVIVGELILSFVKLERWGVESS